MAHATRLPRRDATRLTRREPTVQLRMDPELRIRPQFKLPDWLLLANWSFGGLFSSFSTHAELAEARHKAAQARVRLLEVRVRERLTSRTSRSNASSASEMSRPPTLHEPVLPMTAATSPRSTWRRGRPLQGMMSPPSPVLEIPLASCPRDPALYALRRSEEREFQTEMAHVRAEREFLNAQCA